MNARAAAAGVRARLTAAGIPDAAFEAELLVRQATGLSRSAFFADPALDRWERDTLAALVARREAREPAAYLAGKREFFGVEFAVGPGVLVPRPESELLVEVALEEHRTHPGGVTLDVGTGSGCLAVTIALHAMEAQVVATELSVDALRVARRNVAVLAPHVQLVRTNLASAIAHADIIVANLPYIPSAEIGMLEPEVRDWEPRVALDGGCDGLQLVRDLVGDCGTRLRPRLLALEVMAGQAGLVSLLAARHDAKASVRQDLAGIDRVVIARWQ